MEIFEGAGGNQNNQDATRRCENRATVSSKRAEKNRDDIRLIVGSSPVVVQANQ